MKKMLLLGGLYSSLLYANDDHAKVNAAVRMIHRLRGTYLRKQAELAEKYKDKQEQEYAREYSVLVLHLLLDSISE